MNLKQRAKDILKQSFKSLGLDVSIIKPSAKIKRIDVFSLLIKKHMQDKGEKLSFVVIGANDGVHGDPMRPLIARHGWVGVLVEPQPKVFEKLKRNYDAVKGVVCENAAICEADGNCVLFAFAENPDLPEHASMLASFNRDALAYNNHGYSGEIVGIPVPGLSVKSLLKKHDMTALDILFVDTEGYDYKIIEMFLAINVLPAVIHFEDAFMDRDRRFKCHTELTGKGYSLCEIGVDTVAFLDHETGDFSERAAGQVKY